MLQTRDLKVKWQASLSNGEVFYEGKDPFDFRDGERLPFARFTDYVVDNKLKITSLALVTPDGRTFNLHSSGNRPQFRSFQTPQPPIDYAVERQAAMDVARGEDGQVRRDKQPTNVSVFTVARAIYPDYCLELWVDEMNPKNCWTLVKGREDNG